MRWIPWHRRHPPAPEPTPGELAHRDAERQLREVRERWPEVRSTVQGLRKSLGSIADSDPLVEAVRREFGKRA